MFGIDEINGAMPILPILILVIGVFVTYISGRLLYNIGRPKLTGVISLLFMILSLIPLYQLYVELSPDTPPSTWRILDSQTYLQANGIAIFLGVVGVAMGAFVSMYSIRYMERTTSLEKFYSLLLLMVTGIVGIGFAGDLFNMFVFFELMAIASFALVAFEKEKWEPVEAGIKYIIMSTAGSTTALIGISLIFMYTGTLDLANLHQTVADVVNVNSSISSVLTIGVLLIIIGFGVKAAMVPLHTWLPDAHSAAPSGISAMLSGIVIEAGLIAMIKTLTIFSNIHFGIVIAIFGILTMTVGNLMALPQKDLKRMLAYSSIAQMGYVLSGIGLGFEYGTAAIWGFKGGLFHILNHAFMKGGAFLCAGAVLYMIGTRDINEMRGIGRKMPVVGIAFAIFGLSLAGVPPFSGFVSELLICKAGVDAFTVSSGWSIVFTAALVINTVISLGYYLPAINTILFSRDIGEKAKKAKHAPLSMLIPILLMALITIIFGLLPQLGLDLVEPAVSSLRSLGGI